MADFSNIGTGVYWVGQDGNTYMKASGLDGVQKWVAPLLPPDQLGLQQIADPMAPNDAPPVSGSGTGSGGSATPAKVVNSAAVGATQQAIDSLGTEEAVGEQNITAGRDSLISRYNMEADRTNQDYNEQTVTNKTNLQKNRQNALVSAAQGRRGLRGTLAAMGALSGTGIDLADRAVTTEVNQDLGGATETAATNTAKLDKAMGRFKEEDEVRRNDANTAAANQRTALAGSLASKRQQFYQKMAELYGEGGDTGNAGRFLGMAGDLNNQIAANTRVAATPFAPKNAAFTPGDLESYLAGAGDMTVDVADGGIAGGLNPTSILAGRGRRKTREEEELAVA